MLPRLHRLTKRLTFLLSIVGVLAISHAAHGETLRGDFNGDHFDDLAIGIPGHASGAGGVHVIYGGVGHLTTAGDTFFSQNSAGVSGTEEADDNCGAAIATGDFNGDGFADLAMGCPGETLNGVSKMGVVIVFYGSATGLSTSGAQFWHQDQPGVNGSGEPNDRCGTALAAGDFNGDHRADLAWGCTGEAVGSQAGAGAVNILYGSATGLTSTGSRFLSQDTASVVDAAEEDDACGAALVAADFNDDGRSDLAIGCPGESYGIVDASGAVVVLFGSASGLTGTGRAMIDQSPYLIEGAEVGDQCGSSLAAGDINGDGYADLAYGCPYDDALFAVLPLAGNNQGSIDVRLGGPNGFRLYSGTRQFPVYLPVVPAQNNYRCGTAVAVADFNGDGVAEIAWGCPGGFGGYVQVLVLSDRVNHFWDQDSDGISGASEAGDAWGTALAAGDYNGDGLADLAIGVPGEDLSGIESAGSIEVLYGSPVNGLTAEGSQFLAEAHSGIGGVEVAYDKFGFTLAGSGGAAGPGLTGTWESVTLTCRGRRDGHCTLRGTFTALNPSTQSTPRVVLRFYLSDDQFLDDDDALLDEVKVRRLALGESQERDLLVRLPHDLDAIGQFIIAFIDADNVVAESNEENNVVAFGPVVSSHP
jgi:hypothetical protein